MINETLRKNINVDKENILPISTFKEGDNALLKLALFKNSVEFDVTGQTVKLGAKTSKGLIEQIDGFTISKNNLDIKLKNSILVPGKIEIDLEIKDSNGSMTTASFFITVNRKVLNDEAVEATNEFDTFTKAIDKVETAVKTVTSHTDNTIIHITSTERSNWDSKSNLALGETETTAYRGDLGKKAYTHSQTTHAPSNAQKNVQSDWNVSDTSSDAYIKNKPVIPKAYDDSEIRSSLDNLESEVNELKEGNINIDLTNYATKTELNSKVDKVDGKGLSSNDYTTAEKTKLSGLTNYTHPSTHDASIITQSSSYRFVTDTEKTTWDNKSNFDGNYNNLTNKPTIPSKTSQLTNDSGYLTSIPSEYITESEIAQLEADVNTLKTQGVQQTPIFVNTIEECADTSKIYVLPDGYIYAFMETTEEGKPTHTNLADTTSSEWLTDTRLSTSSTSPQTGAFTTNYIPCKLNDTIRIKGLDVRYYTGTSNARFHILKEDKTLAYSDCGYVPTLITNGYASISGDIITIKAGWTGNATSASFSNTAFQRFCGKLMSGYTVGDVIITVNQEIKNSETVVVKKWISTGIKFVSGNYDNEILDLQIRTSSLETSNTLHESRISILESGGASGGTSQTVPSYWESELATKEDAIQQAMEIAGQNKSAFLWYTDAHWTAGNSMMSPLLLNHIHKNTSMTKVFFGGDIIGDPTELTHNTVKHLYTNWRNKLKGLEHHSVIGNHDNIHKGRNDSNLTNTVYSFLIAPEENKNMVIGGDLYYYIDEPCEKTRYLFLDSGRFSLSDDETKFVIDTLTSVQSGWHIVVISHIWFQYTSASAPTVGSINASMQKILNVFDDYNSRKSGTVTMVSTSHSYSFASCGGKVEFCIGGHIHVDHNVSSTGGIPVILTASDVNQERSSDETEDCGELGKISESAVFGIIANYTTKKITIVGIGRGTSREITY